MPRRRRLLTALSAVVCVLVALGGAASASARTPRVPQGFIGTVVGQPLFPSMATTPELGTQLDQMVGIGVEHVRAVFDWSTAQPYQDWSQVPASQRAQFQSDGVDGVPTDFAAFDALVGQAAVRHLPVLPVVLNAPRWDAISSRTALLSIPRRDAPYAAFMRALVLRYGPHGSFWTDHAPALPVNSWQIWNEPNISPFWPVQPFATRYVGLLRAARTAIKRVDPRATIVLAGLANYSWQSLRSIYRVPGARKLFDVVGLHPYTRTPQDVITIIRLGRQVMQSFGDGAKPIIADEISWPSSLGKTIHNTGYDFATTEAGQARDVAQALQLLAANRVKLHIAGVFYYTWVTIERRNGLAFDFAGLLRYAAGQFVRKPVFASFRHAALALEHCRVKGAVANGCRVAG